MNNAVHGVAKLVKSFGFLRSNAESLDDFRYNAGAVWALVAPFLVPIALDGANAWNRGKRPNG
jgi:hypothetical protein